MARRGWERTQSLVIAAALLFITDTMWSSFAVGQSSRDDLLALPLEQLHIAYAGRSLEGSPDGMTISWSTVEAAGTPQVRFGLSPGQMNGVATGTSVRYYQTWHHHVTLEGLSQGSVYYYSAGQELPSAVAWSAVRSFRVAPETQSWRDEGRPLRVAAYGDMGLVTAGDTFERLRKLSSENDIDFIWQLGDIAYADDAFLETPFSFGYERKWDTFMRKIEEMTSAETPYMVLPGNHEAECHSPACQMSINKLRSLSNFTAYNARFRMPGEESGGAKSMWYSFNVGPVHFVSISTETDFENAFNDEWTWRRNTNGRFGDQIAWLKEDLRKADKERDVRPWIVVGGHRPMYCLEVATKRGKPSDYAATVQAAFEDIFAEYGVDLFLAGHAHTYERQYPVYRSRFELSYANANRTVHIVTGAAGNIEGLGSYRSQRRQPWHVTGQTDFLGFSVLELDPLKPQDLRVTFVRSSDGAVTDEVVLSQDRSSRCVRRSTGACSGSKVGVGGDSSGAAAKAGVLTDGLRH